MASELFLLKDVYKALQDCPINYRIINDALEFYQTKGYTYIEVPWQVPIEIVQVTFPEIVSLSPDVPVGSAEQSLVWLASEGLLDLGKKYVCCSPCFRHEFSPPTTLPQFFKVELFASDLHYTYLLNDAAEFMYRYSKGVYLVNTALGQDLALDGLELGSYGERVWEDLRWNYGTGVAEPRFSYAISKNPGYHNMPIPKGTLGHVDKIQEELYELVDSYQARNKIMMGVECSDLLGALLQFAKTLGLRLEDLVQMLETTERAFKNERRK